MIKIILSISFLVLCNFYTAQTITVEITNVRNSDGHLLLGIYTNDKDYQDKTAILKKTVLKEDLVNGTVTATIEGLEPGTYGIALMDDEDWDRKMKYYMFLPKEGFAFSNYYHDELRKPHFEDFKFILSEKGKVVVMKCRYL